MNKLNDEKTAYEYAHNNTSSPERESRTLAINTFCFDEQILRLRKGAFERGIPVSSDETLAFLLTCVKMAKPQRILEIGTAIGVSGLAMLNACKNARLTTLEVNNDFANEAKRNFADAGVGDRVTLLQGDAAQILPTLEGCYDFVFLDGPKVQYIKYLPYIKKLLNVGGTLFSDDILMYGWVNGEKPVPPKRRMLVEHIREYLKALQSDKDLFTQIVDVGNGVALSIKNN